MTAIIDVAVVSRPTDPAEVRLQLGNGPGESRSWVDLSPDDADLLAAMLSRAASRARGAES